MANAKTTTQKWAVCVEFQKTCVRPTAEDLKRRKSLDKLFDMIDSAGLYDASARYAGTEASKSMIPKLPPPAGFGSWLAYAVRTINVRSLHVQIKLGGQKQWPNDTSTDDMRKAAKDELAELEQHSHRVDTKGPGLSAVVHYLADEALYEGYFVGVEGMFWRAPRVDELTRILTEQAKSLEHRPDRVAVAVLHFRNGEKD